MFFEIKIILLKKDGTKHYPNLFIIFNKVKFMFFGYIHLII